MHEAIIHPPHDWVVLAPQYCEHRWDAGMKWRSGGGKGCADGVSCSSAKIVSMDCAVMFLSVSMIWPLRLHPRR